MRSTREPCAAVVLLVLSALAGCSSGAAESAAPLTYQGSSTIGETVLPDLIAGFERASGEKFGAVRIAGSSEGLKAVMAGDAAVGGMSRALTGAEKARSPYYEIIGYDALSVFVNEKNPVEGLTRSQVKDMFAGRITCWSGIGGAEGPIEVVTGKKDGHHGTLEFFNEAAMDRVPFGATTEFESQLECVRRVAGAPGAITNASFAFEQDGVKAVHMDGVDPTRATIRSGEYVLARPLLLVSKAAPEGAAKAFFDFVLSPEGQAIVAKKFVPRKEPR